jgi:hypothetical protein
LLCITVLISAPSFANDPLHWVKATGDAGWKPRDSQGEVVYNDRMWIFGGWFDSYEAPPRDVWSSADGVNWTRVSEAAPWIHSDLSMSLTFHDRMWFMGGWYNGRLDGHSASNAVWSSTDGVNWEQTAGDERWSPRIASAVAVFKDRMWVLGGTENYYFGDQSSLKNDVWSSPDGTTWELVTAEAGWAPRAYHQAAVLNDRLYVFGGGNYVPEYQAFNDVWVTDDGSHWEQVTAGAPWAPRIWFSSEVYRDRMWVIGGASKSDTGWKNWGDVWYSQDGATWTELKTATTWKERHEHSVFVFEDKLWVAGGHAQPLSSEVWSLEIPAGWFEE